MRLPPLRNVAFVAAGGAVGATARVALAAWFPVDAGAFPWTTFLENVIGALLLGFLLTWLLEDAPVDPTVRLAVCTGALGAFTTYSAFVVELDRLAAGGQTTMAVLYTVGSLLGGVIVAFSGMSVARRMCAHRRRGSSVAGRRGDDR